MSSKSVVSLWRYCNFSNFQNGRRHHLGFFEIEKFYLLLGRKGLRRISMRPPSWIVEFTKFHWLTVAGWPRHITSPNFVKIGSSLAEMAIFRNFKMATAAILDFWNLEILLAIRVSRVETHQHAKLCQNRSIGRKYIMIIRFFKMVAAAILNCRIHKILLAVGVWRAHMHHFDLFTSSW